MERLLCLISGMNSGGAETFLMNTYRELDREKYQMDFCVNITKQGFYDEEIQRMGGRIYHIPSKSENLKEFKLQLTDIIRKEKYKCVLRITSNTMGFLDLKIAKNAGAIICAARSSNSSDAEGIKARIVHFLGRILYSKYVNVKIAPSDLAAIYTFGEKNYQKGCVHILKNAIDLNVYRFSLVDRVEIREELGIQKNDIVCGHIGRFSKQKNHKFLLEIFAEMHKEEKNIKLLLVGGGELEKEVRLQCKQLMIEESVIFCGIRSDIPAILSAMDVFVFPSLYEGMPNTVLEAQATGLPCVISDSITREAAITSLVHYQSLNDDKKLWAKTALELTGNPRKSMTLEMKEAGYDILDEVKKFENLLFHI